LPPPPWDLTNEGKTAASNGDKDGGAPEDDTVVEGNFLYNSICTRLLERALTLLSSIQRDELLALKRAYAAEQRVVLEHFCQLEGDMIRQVVQQDLDEYQMQVSTRLLADQEHQICEERKKLVGQVGEEVTMHVETFRRQIEEEAQAIVTERRKWLTDRLVILQANGSVGPSDRALLQRLRQELRACESKIELHNNEFLKEKEPLQQAKETPRNDVEKVGGRAPSRPASGNRKPARLPAAGRKSPQAPATPRAHSQEPRVAAAQDHMLQPAATGQIVPQLPSAPSFGSDNGSVGEFSSRLKDHWRPLASPRSQPLPQAPASPRLPLPQFGNSAAEKVAACSPPGFSVDGPAWLGGRCGGCAGASGAALPDFGPLRSAVQQPVQQPLYEWPFESTVAEASASRLPTPSAGHTPRSLSVPVSPRLKPLDCLAPLKHVLNRCTEESPRRPPPAPPFGNSCGSGVGGGLGDVAAIAGAFGSVGCGAGGGGLSRCQASVAEPLLVDVGTPRLSLKPPTRNRSVPPLLPPVQTPR